MIIGFITGMLSAMLGIGGGVLFVPTLLFTLPVILPGSQVIPVIAISTSLLAGSLASSSAFLNHLRIKNIDIKSAFFLSLGSSIMAVFVPQIVVNLPADTVKYLLCGVLLIVSLKMFFDKNGKTRDLHLSESTLIIFGALVGTVSAVGGLGGGIFFVPILHYLYGFDLKKAVGTSTLPVAVTMITSSVSYGFAPNPETFSYQWGYIHLVSGVLLGLFAVAGSFLGIRLIGRVQNQKMKKIFAVLLFIMIAKLLW